MARVNLEASLSAEQKAKTTLCAAALESLLEQYDCSLIAVPYIGPEGTIGTEIHVMPKGT